MKNIIIGIILFLFVFSLSGCYCFYKSANTDVRNFDTEIYIHPCCISPGGTRPIIFYYGFPNTDLKPLKKDSLNFKSLGMIGCRMEKYVAPFKSIPYKILGLGIDYSFSNISSNNSISTLQKDFYRNRIQLNSNLITLVQNKIIGYINFQGGIEFLKIKSIYPNSSLGVKNVEKSINLSMRLGYGFQYYLNPNFALLAEAGYGAGVIGKTGICYWF